MLPASLMKWRKAYGWILYRNSIYPATIERRGMEAMKFHLIITVKLYYRSNNEIDGYEAYYRGRAK